MSEDTSIPGGLKVEGRVEDGIVILTIHYKSDVFIMEATREKLRKELITEYREIEEREVENIKNDACIVDIQADTAGSALVRALFEIWKEVVEEECGTEAHV